MEKSPTLGSIESTDLEKRSLAYKSIEFNLKDKFVLDLFPDDVLVWAQVLVYVLCVIWRILWVAELW